MATDPPLVMLLFQINDSTYPNYCFIPLAEIIQLTQKRNSSFSTSSTSLLSFVFDWIRIIIFFIYSVRICFKNQFSFSIMSHRCFFLFPFNIWYRYYVSGPSNSISFKMYWPIECQLFKKCLNPEVGGGVKKHQLLACPFMALPFKLFLIAFSFV